MYSVILPARAGATQKFQEETALKCPNCGCFVDAGERSCPMCGLVLASDPPRRSTQPSASPERPRSRAPGAETPPTPGKVLSFPQREGAPRWSPRSRSSLARRIALVSVMVLCWLFTIVCVGVGVYKAYFWIQSALIEHRYDSGEAFRPTVEEITLDDGRLGHAITFFGQDGDTIFIKELRQSYMVIGGSVCIEIPDSSWFDVNPSEVEAAQITLTPVRTGRDGERELLPSLHLEIPVPQSPLTLIQPASEREEINTSIYPLELKVVPGSTVLVGGNNVSDVVDRMGNLSVNVPTDLQGENLISILVSTPHHRETRQDIALVRPYMEINLELDLNIEKTSTRNTMSVYGVTDPAADIVVDTPCVEGSIEVNRETGAFSFTAQLETYGENIIQFRAVMEGKQDSVLSLSVNYTPSLNEYSRKAWKMDYPSLSKLSETWEGRIFACNGTILEVLSTEPSVVVMDVSEDGGTVQPIILENLSATALPEVGKRYRAFADVVGYEYYGKNQVPKLTARFMDPEP